MTGEESVELHKAFFRAGEALVARVAGEIARAFAAGNKVTRFGNGGSALGSRVRYHLNVPHPLPARVQEVHILIGHLLCQLSEDALAPEARG